MAANGKKKNGGYPPEVKAAALAALLEGQAVSHVAREYRIPESTIKNWRADAKRAARVGPKSKTEIGELLLEYLRANLAALARQAEVFADPVWLQQQGAQEAAVLHGVMTDKAVRLMEALGGSGE